MTVQGHNIKHLEMIPALDDQSSPVQRSEKGGSVLVDSVTENYADDGRNVGNEVFKKLTKNDR